MAANIKEKNRFRVRFRSNINEPLGDQNVVYIFQYMLLFLMFNEGLSLLDIKKFKYLRYFHKYLKDY